MDVSIFRLRVMELFDYDPLRGKLFWKVSKGTAAAGKEAGSIHHTGYLRVKIDGKLYFVHRLIFLIENGYLPEFIDHKDGDKLNNRIENLRPCSLRENNRNKSKYSNNTSGIVGISLHKASNKWQARCADRHGKETHLGYFQDIQVAAEVVKAFRIREHGEFAADHREAA